MLGHVYKTIQSGGNRSLGSHAGPAAMRERERERMRGLRESGNRPLGSHADLLAMRGGARACEETEREEEERSSFSFFSSSSSSWP